MRTPLDQAAAILGAARALQSSAALIRESVALASRELERATYDCAAGRRQRERMGQISARVLAQGRSLDELAVLLGRMTPGLNGERP